MEYGRRRRSDLHLLAVEVGAEEEDELDDIDEDEDEEERAGLPAAEHVRRHEAGVVEGEAQADLVEREHIGGDVHEPHEPAEEHGGGVVAGEDEDGAPDVDPVALGVFDHAVGGEGDAAVEVAAGGEEGGGPELGEVPVLNLLASCQATVRCMLAKGLLVGAQSMFS